MAVWRLESNIDYYGLGLIYDSDAKVTTRFIGESFGQKWRPLLVELIQHKGAELGNFLNLSPGILVCDQVALEIIEPLISASVEVLPLQCESGSFWAINVTNIVDCLDRSSSEFEYLASGNLKRISRYVFKSNCVENEPIFKIPERRGKEIFVLDDFKQLVESNGLKGLTFRKVWEE